jgi:hypothetical protein
VFHEVIGLQVQGNVRVGGDRARAFEIGDLDINPLQVSTAGREDPLGSDHLISAALERETLRHWIPEARRRWHSAILGDLLAISQPGDDERGLISRSRCNDAKERDQT